MFSLTTEEKLKYVEDSLINTKEYYSVFFKMYRERVEKFYKDIYDETPEYFPFVNPIKVIIIFQNYNFYIFYCTTENEDEVTYLIDFAKDWDEFNSIKELPDHDKINRLINNFNIVNYIEIAKDDYGLSFPKPYIELYDDFAVKDGREICDGHYKKYKLEMALNKTTKPSSEFPLFDLEPLLNKVNDSDFKYELQEAVKAYNSGLYLASVVTAAVSLETLLKLSIVKKLGNKYSPKDDRQKYTLNYAKILLENDLIDERLNHRIRSLNELRRGGAHSKTGKIEQWDAEQIISGIKIVVESLFDEGT